ncbi:glycosyltransferase [Yeosuana sp. AK3]
MKLSVLIPMYNAETYITNCLNSINNQGFIEEEFEVIIIDDGSKDNSVEIVTNYLKNHQNHSLYNESNSGSDSTRNKLLKKAKGDYIYFLDADDYLADNTLNKLLNYALTKNLDFVGFDTLETTNLGEFELKDDFATCFDQLKIISGSQFIKKNRHLRHEVWWYLVKKDLLVKHNICFDENGNNADVIFTIKILLRTKKMAYCPFAIHRYVQTTTSVMRDKSIEKRRKLIDSMYLMIISYSKLINSIQTEIIDDKEIILENLKFRRDVFTFFNILNMIKEKYSKNDLNIRINDLIQINAYPIENFLNDYYDNLKYRLLINLVNNKTILTNLALIRNSFHKII